MNKEDSKKIEYNQLRLPLELKFLHEDEIKKAIEKDIYSYDCSEGEYTILEGLIEIRKYQKQIDIIIEYLIELKNEQVIELEEELIEKEIDAEIEAEELEDEEEIDEDKLDVMQKEIDELGI